VLNVNISEVSICHHIRKTHKYLQFFPLCEDSERLYPHNL
jgi:hypothetical protein